MADIEKLRATLTQLHEQIESLDEVDPEVRAMLHGAFYDIHHKLEAMEAGPPEPATKEPAPPAGAETPPPTKADDSKPEASEESIPGRLTEAVQHFEESHPSLASTLGGLIDTLSQMGF